MLSPGFNRNSCKLLAVAYLGALLLVGHPLAAQVDSRAEEIKAARREKAQHLEPDGVPKGEKALREITEGRLLERISAGIAPPRGGSQRQEIL